MERRLSALTWGGLDGMRKQPIQGCMIERPEVSRGHSTARGKDRIKRAYELGGKGWTAGVSRTRGE
jgi:hypothetical protein